MTKRKILQIIELLQKEGLLTNSKTNELVYERFKNSNDVDEVVQFILTSGEVRGGMECSKCRKNLPGVEFSFYQTRVSSDGYLMRSNALCRACSSKMDKERAEVLKEEAENIPPKPKAGSKCPNCGRKWSGQWHRHHDAKEGKFIDWLCSNCNMAMHDQRNPETKYGR